MGEGWGGRCMEEEEGIMHYSSRGMENEEEEGEV